MTSRKNNNNKDRSPTSDGTPRDKMKLRSDSSSSISHHIKKEGQQQPKDNDDENNNDTIDISSKRRIGQRRKCRNIDNGKNAVAARDNSRNNNKKGVHTKETKSLGASSIDADEHYDEASLGRKRKIHPTSNRDSIVTKSTKRNSSSELRDRIDNNLHDQMAMVTASATDTVSHCTNEQHDQHAAMTIALPMTGISTIETSRLVASKVRPRGVSKGEEDSSLSSTGISSSSPPKKAVASSGGVAGVVPENLTNSFSRRSSSRNRNLNGNKQIHWPSPTGSSRLSVFDLGTTRKIPTVCDKRNRQLQQRKEEEEGKASSSEASSPPDSADGKNPKKQKQKLDSYYSNMETIGLNRFLRSSNKKREKHL